MNEERSTSVLTRTRRAIFPAARLVGVALYFARLLTYHSSKNRPVFGIWSYPFLIVVVTSGGLVLAALVAVWRGTRRGSCPTPSAKLVDLAILLWGIAYFLAGIAEPTEAGRVIVLNFLGSCSTMPALLEWLALVLLFFSLLPLIFSNLHKKRAKVSLTVVSVLFLFVLLEGFLRVKAVVAPVDEGYPTCSSLQWKQHNEKMNREGWRDVEHSRSAAPGTRRLLIVGDSVAHGWGIPDIQNRLGEEVADRLRQKTGEQWEPINASVGGANTLDEIGFLKKTISYDPDIVLLIYVFNDIDYLAPQITPKLTLIARYYPQWVLYSNFYLFQEIIIRVRLIYYRFFESEDSKADPYMDQTLLSRHFQDIVRFVTIASEKGATVRVVPFEMDPNPQFRARYKYFVPQATAAGIPICSLEHTFDGYKLPQLTVNALDGHPNELANRLAADTVAQCLYPLVSHHDIDAMQRDVARNSRRTPVAFRQAGS